MSPHDCSEMVWERGTWPRQYPCSRRGVVERNGKWWCKQHDPVAVAERRDAEDRKYAFERDLRNARDAFERACWDFKGEFPEPLESLRTKARAISAERAKEAKT